MKSMQSFGHFKYVNNVIFSLFFMAIKLFQMVLELFS